MTAAVAGKRWTDEEILAAPRDGRKREIVGGEWIMMSPAGFEHGAIIERLAGEMYALVRAKGLGELADGQTGYRLVSGDLFCPDISFVSAERVANHRAQGHTFFRGAPDLFVEVLSPSDTVEILQEKLEQFFAEGTRLAWVINPRKKCVHVHRAPVASRIVQIQETLEGEDVLPGFSLPLSRIFI